MDIKLSSNTLVNCPEKGFALRRVVKCLQCKYYMGLQKAQERGKEIEGNDADFFHVICGRPITRKD